MGLFSHPFFFVRASGSESDGGGRISVTRKRRKLTRNNNKNKSNTCIDTEGRKGGGNESRQRHSKNSREKKNSRIEKKSQVNECNAFPVKESRKHTTRSLEK